MAIHNGLCINIDAMDELDFIDDICTRLGKEVDIGIRLKLDLDPLANRHGVAMHGPGTLKEQSDSTKWGMSRAQTVEIVKRAQTMQEHPSQGDAFPSEPHDQRPARLRRHGARDDRLVGAICATRPAGRRPASTSAAAGPSASPTAPGPKSQLDDAVGADRRRLCRALLRRDQGGSAKHEPAAAEAAPGARPLAFRTGGRRRRPRRRGQAGREEEVGQPRPLDQPPVLGGGARLVLSRGAGGERRRQGQRSSSISSVRSATPTRSAPSARCRRSNAAISSPSSTPAATPSPAPRATTRSSCRRRVLVSGDQAEIITEREQLKDIAGRFRVPPRLLAASFAPAG